MEQAHRLTASRSSHLFPESIPCTCAIPSTAECVCTPVERAIRSYAAGKATEPMTYFQRDFCVDEANRLDPARYPKTETRELTDQELAAAVRAAWVAEALELVPF